MWFLHISAIIFPPQRLTTYIYIYTYIYNIYIYIYYIRIYIYVYIRIKFPSESIPPGRQFLTPARRSKKMASNLESTQCQPPFSGTSGIPCIAPGVVDSLEFPTWLVRGFKRLQLSIHEGGLPKIILVDYVPIPPPSYPNFITIRPPKCLGLIIMFSKLPANHVNTTKNHTLIFIS